MAGNIDRTGPGKKGDIAQTLGSQVGQEIGQLAQAMKGSGYGSKAGPGGIALLRQSVADLAPSG